jgi:hypothetical protein
MLTFENAVKNVGLEGFHAIQVDSKNMIYINEPLNDLSPREVPRFHSGNLALSIRESTQDLQFMVIKGNLLFFTFEIKDQMPEGPSDFHTIKRYGIEDEPETATEVFMRQKTGRIYEKSDLFTIPAGTIYTFYCSPFHWSSFQVTSISQNSNPEFLYTNRPEGPMNPLFKENVFTQEEFESLKEKAGLSSFLEKIA